MGAKRDALEARVAALETIVAALATIAVREPTDPLSEPLDFTAMNTTAAADYAHYVDDVWGMTVYI